MAGTAVGTERVLGIDPGTAAIGFGLIDHGSRGDLAPVWYGCLRTSVGESASARLVSIYRACRDTIDEFSPTAAAVEELFFGASAKTALAVGQARGVCMLACAHAGLEVFEYAPAAIKSAVAGHGRADKMQVQQMVQSVLGMTALPKPDHAADALAAAICHASGSALRRRILDPRIVPRMPHVPD